MAEDPVRCCRAKLSIQADATICCGAAALLVSRWGCREKAGTGNLAGGAVTVPVLGSAGGPHLLPARSLYIGQPHPSGPCRILTRATVCVMVVLFGGFVAQYMVEQSGVTLLPHFMALFRTTVNDKCEYLLVFRNVHSCQLDIDRVYDLKGSRVDRDASATEMQKELPVMKDNDFVFAGERLRLGAEQKALFMDKLKQDVEFLAKLKLMVGVARRRRGHTPAFARTLSFSTPCPRLREGGGGLTLCLKSPPSTKLSVHRPHAVC